MVGGGFGGAFAVQRLQKNWARRGRNPADRPEQFLRFPPISGRGGHRQLAPAACRRGTTGIHPFGWVFMGEFTGADLQRKVTWCARRSGWAHRNPLRPSGPGLGSVTSLPPIDGLLKMPCRSRGWPMPSPCATVPSVSWSKRTRVRIPNSAKNCCISPSSAPASPGWRWRENSKFF